MYSFLIVPHQEIGMAPHSRHFPTKKPKRHVSFRLHNIAAQKKPRLILFWWNQLKDWFSGAAAIDTVAVGVIQLHLRFRASLDSNPIKGETWFTDSCRCSWGKKLTSFENPIDMVWLKFPTTRERISAFISAWLQSSS